MCTITLKLFWIDRKWNASPHFPVFLFCLFLFLLSFLKFQMLRRRNGLLTVWKMYSGRETASHSWLSSTSSLEKCPIWACGACKIKKQYGPNMPPHPPSPQPQIKQTDHWLTNWRQGWRRKKMSAPKVHAVNDFVPKCPNGNGHCRAQKMVQQQTLIFRTFIRV